MKQDEQLDCSLKVMSVSTTMVAPLKLNDIKGEVLLYVSWLFSSEKSSIFAPPKTI